MIKKDTLPYKSIVVDTVPPNSRPDVDIGLRRLRTNQLEEMPGRTLVGHTGKVFSVAFSADDKLLASGGKDNTIRLWDADSGEQIQTFTGHTDGVVSVGFSPDGKTLASAGRIDHVKLWDVKSGEHLHTLFGHDKVYCVAFSSDGKTLASGSWENTVMLWKIE